MKILLVDDDRAFRGLLFDYLHPDHDVAVLSDGRNAVSLLADPSHGFDLVILDLRMPRFSGYDVLTALGPGAGGRARLLVASGFVDRDALSRFPGWDGVLEKPFPLFALNDWLLSAEARKN